MRFGTLLSGVSMLTRWRIFQREWLMFLSVVLSYFIMFLLSGRAFAEESSMSLTPPVTDVSVIYLENIFGVVDGVLSGTGSQIMGSIFGVFNSAVLAVGGIIIMYILIVATMNTAHEGQMLGQKWSSIWIPIRTTIGLALLIPKSSGYCMMQIFFMWVVVQGIGAADKIWDAALDYLNRGGVIIKAQMSSAASLSADNSGIAMGASVILSGQVCMIGMSQLLEAQRQLYLTQAQSKTGPCYTNQSENVQEFCNTSVPDFTTTVDPVTYQQDHEGQNTFKLPMPNFDSSSIYYTLNGICGTIQWDALSSSSSSSSSQTDAASQSLNTQEIQLSRAIGIQQMLSDLYSVASSMVSNDPQINTSNTTDSSRYFSTIAVGQFGVPYMSTGSGSNVVCNGLNNSNCTSWQADESNTTAPVIFAGTEFQYAVSDYNAIMAPTLNLQQEAKNASDAANARQFISDAKTKGWLMAGSYFFNLVQINGDATSGTNQTDTKSGLNNSTFDPNVLVSPFTSSGGCQDPYAALCHMFNYDPTAMQNLTTLINGNYNGSSQGTSLVNPVQSTPSFSSSASHPAYTGIGSTTAYGYINNAAMITLPDQAGTTPPKFSTNFSFEVSMAAINFQLPSLSIDCAHRPFIGCIGTAVIKTLYNDVFIGLFGFFIGLFNQTVNLLIMTFLVIPFNGMMQIFLNGVSIIEQPGTNPIVALANMGTAYINFSMTLWLTMIEVALVCAFLPFIGMVVMALIGLVMPFLLAWLGIMLSIGFLTAYYVPFLPYMIFLFGGIAWLMLVVEAMAAAPLVALGITYPEGGDALGKGEPGMMILLNIFLRPGMMVLGFIGGFSLSYVGIWVLNEGFQQVYNFMAGSEGNVDYSFSYGQTPQTGMDIGYVNWAGMYATFFAILIYTMMYLTLVEKAFGLIYILPDKVLRWIGGPSETSGQEAAQWAQDVKSKMGEAGGKTTEGGAQVTKKLGGYAEKGIAKAKSAIGSSVEATPGEDEE